MRHGRKNKKLGRTASHRKALLANLCIELMRHKRIKTTLTKAKEAGRLAERLITYAKQSKAFEDQETSLSLSKRRKIISSLNNTNFHVQPPDVTDADVEAYAVALESRISKSRENWESLNDKKKRKRAFAALSGSRKLKFSELKNEDVENYEKALMARLSVMKERWDKLSKDAKIRRVKKHSMRKTIVSELVDEIAPRMIELDETRKSKNPNYTGGGYTRVLKLGRRNGDGASMAILELVGFEKDHITKQEQAAEKKETRKKTLAERIKEKKEEMETGAKS